MPGHRKPLPTASCIFTSDWWNDSEQRNYILYECKNPKNTGGNSNIPHGDFHGSRTYSCWYDNAGMKYRCGSKSEKIEGCPIAVAKTKPEVDCERFIEEEAHPSFALITKEGIRKEFYQTDALCVSCENCLE